MKVQEIPNDSFILGNKAYPRPTIMGIINTGQDSFCSKNRSSDIDQALSYATQMIADGAVILDIGGEPTNPKVNGKPSDAEELERVVPVIQAIRQQSSIPISIDTSSPLVMEAAVEAGATIINDVRALRVPGALEMASELNLPVCLMHMANAFNNPGDSLPCDVKSIVDFLNSRINECLNAGIKSENIVIDPGFGGGAFGKTPRQDLAIVRHLSSFCDLGYPVLLGVSRKSCIGQVLNVDVDQRIYGSIALSLLGLQNGASIIRTHDVLETAQAIKIWQAALEESECDKDFWN